MKDLRSVFKNLLNKLAAKRFSKKERKIILVGVIILIITSQFIINYWINKLKKETVVIAPIIPKGDVDLPAVDDATGEKIGNSQQKRKPDLRDPFLSSRNPDFFKKIKIRPIANLKVSGILWDAKVPTAIINSQVVKIGDIIHGKTVVDMEKDKVVLMENGEIYVLEFKR